MRLSPIAQRRRRLYPELPEIAEIQKKRLAYRVNYRMRVSFELTWQSYVAYLVTEECVDRVESQAARFIWVNCFECIQSRISWTTLYGTRARTSNQFSITS